MVYKLALFSNLLLASVATMAVPFSQLGARLARGEGLQSQPSNRDVSESNEAPDSSAGIVPDTTYNQVWAGARVARSDLPFKNVTATFTVPTVSRTGTNTLGGILIGVGVGGPIPDPTCNVLFMSGLRIRIIRGVAVYNAMYQWYPARARNFPVASIRAGDNITLTVGLISMVKGTAIVINHTRGWMMGQNVTAGSLCSPTAHWIVEDFVDSGSYIPIANFGTVAFRNATAFQPGGKCNGSNDPESCNVRDATQMYDIRQNGVRLTETTVTGLEDEPVLTIKYTGPV